MRFDLGECVGGQLSLRGFGGGIGFFEVAEDEDVFVVQGAGGAGVVEAASAGESFVDDHEFVVDLADAGAGLVLEELHSGGLERLGGGPSLRAFSRSRAPRSQVNDGTTNIVSWLQFLGAAAPRVARWCWGCESAGMCDRPVLACPMQRQAGL